MKLVRIYLLLFMLLSVQCLRAQQPSLSNLRYKTIRIADSVVQLDSLSIIPGTLQVQNVPPSAYLFDPVNATLTWINRPSVSIVQVQYRVFAYRLNTVVRRFNYDSVRYFFIREQPMTFDYNSQPRPVLDFGNINSAGSFGRSISFGNAQNAVLNSSFNLQLNGMIGDSLELTAAITDNNIPIQPDGNTQTLNDFDKVFLQVRKKDWQLNLGDIDLKQNNSYFLNFYKRLQGASFITENKLAPGIDHKLLVSGSVAKGKFTQNTIVPVEGDQGPYKLQDPNNDIVFTVLAGTEKVFLDGQLLQRGQDQDYVINYNTAEITFTPKIMITKDSRIQVNFEYADRNYLNSNLYLSDEITIHKKLVLNVGLFSNQDAKNSPINQSLDSSQKHFLSGIGSDINNAYYPSARLDTFSASRIEYKKIDTVYNTSIHDSIYVISTNPSDTVYSLGFTNVGPGNGNYIQVADAANGQAFQWIAPDINNVKQGDWDPVVLLVTPKKQQLITLGAQYALNEQTHIKTEFALSNYNVNLFSHSNASSVGTAGKIDVSNINDKIKAFKQKLTLQTQVGYEFEQRNFKPLERIHTIEFSRDWSLPEDAAPADERLAYALFQLSDRHANNLQYRITNYNRSDSFNGIQQQLQHTLFIKGWKLNDQISLTTTTYQTSYDFYIRPTVDLSKALKQYKNLQVGVNYTGEHNRLRDKITDTLSALSFAFDQWQAYLKSDPGKRNNWGISFFTRNDFLPRQSGLLLADRSNNINISGELASSKKRQLRFNLTYRQLYVTDTLLTTQRSDNSILGRIEYQFNEWNGFVKGNALYELGSGQEQKLQYTYVQVQAGQGQYQWIDYNGNGVAELNEFELASFQDQANYIRVLTPSAQYVKANYIQFNYRIELNPQSLFHSKTVSHLQQLLARINTSSSLQIDKKEIAAGGRFDFNPFTKKIIDTALISLSSFLTNTFYFNRVNPKWGFDITHSLSNSKVLYTYGVESHQLINLVLKTRWNISRSLLANVNLHSNKDMLTTPAFDNRNYAVAETGMEPSISFIRKTTFRLMLSYAYDHKINQTGYNDKAISNVLSADLKYTILSNSSIEAHFSFNSIAYTSDSTGSANTTVGYSMLGGLLPGNNYLWTISYTKRLAGNIEMTLEYDARKPGEEKIVNTGKASIRALF